MSPLDHLAVDSKLYGKAVSFSLLLHVLKLCFPPPSPQLWSDFIYNDLEGMYTFNISIICAIPFKAI